jgi:regulation of enolase protein 1 (concanavalin A-like superfamily)
MFEQGVWLNEPRVWRAEAALLTATTDARTDFWRETGYGFTHDNGHFFGRETGAFTASLRVQARYESQFDQAGLMVRLDEANWIKAGVEFCDGYPMIGSVLTVGRSDWTTARFWADPSDFWLRVTVAGGVLRLQVSTDGKVWPLLRLCPFPVAERYLVGPMCCTPERAGLEVIFSEFVVGPPSGRDIHDLG